MESDKIFKSIGIILVAIFIASFILLRGNIFADFENCCPQGGSDTDGVWWEGCCVRTTDKDLWECCTTAGNCDPIECINCGDFVDDDDDPDDDDPPTPLPTDPCATVAGCTYCRTGDYYSKKPLHYYSCGSCRYTAPDCSVSYQPYCFCPCTLCEPCVGRYQPYTYQTSTLYGSKFMYCWNEPLGVRCGFTFKLCSCTENCIPDACPSGTAESPDTGYFTTVSCVNNCRREVVRTCYYQRENLCSSTLVSPQWIKSGQTSTVTATAKTPVNYFTYAFNNSDNTVSGVPQPICVSTYDAVWSSTQGSCPAGTYQLMTTLYYSTATTISTLSVPASRIFVADMNNGGTQVKSVQVGVYFRVTGGPISYLESACISTINYCNPLCSPCGTSYSTTDLGYGSLFRTCNNSPLACGGLSSCPCGSEAATCYCKAPCSSFSCPAPLGNTVSPPQYLSNLILDNFISCVNECNHSSVGDCYEPFSPQPLESLEIVEDEANDYGFSSKTHTGKPLDSNSRLRNLNEPINMTAVFSDEKVEDIEGVFVWFRNSAYTEELQSPVLLSETAAPRAPSNDSWGFMFHRVLVGVSPFSGPIYYWEPYIPSYVGTEVYWRKVVNYSQNLRQFYINGPNGGWMVKVSLPTTNVTDNRVNNTVKMDFQLEFENEDIMESVSEVKYNIFLMGLDKFSYTPYDNYSFIDISAYWSPTQLRYKEDPAQHYARDWSNTGYTWSIDKAKPDVTLNTPEAIGDNKLRISWTANDDKNLYTLVGNIYTTDPAHAQAITLLPNSSTPSTLQFSSSMTPAGYDGENVGRINTDWAFIMPNVNDSNASEFTGNNLSGSIDIDIGENQFGSLMFVLTIFDDAGNIFQNTQVYDLQDWFVTDGGLVYSAGGTSYKTKSLDPTVSWEGILPPPTIKKSTAVESLSPLKADYSSEMWAQKITDNLIAMNNSGTTGSYTIKGHSINNPTSYYNTLLEMYEKNKSLIPGLKESFLSESTLVSSLNDTKFCGISPYCTLKYVNNLIVNGSGTNFRCSSRGLIFVGGNLTLIPRIINTVPDYTDDKLACIFVVKGNVVIQEGSSISSSTELGYDSINAFIIADGDIIINHENKPAGSIIDGVYVNGGLYTLGSIKIKRHLRLEDKMIYPVLVIDSHPKYGVLAGVLFSSESKITKMEQGIKP